MTVLLPLNMSTMRAMLGAGAAGAAGATEGALSLLLPGSSAARSTICRRDKRNVTGVEQCIRQLDAAAAGTASGPGKGRAGSFMACCIVGGCAVRADCD